MKTIYYEVNRKCFDRKIGDTVTKRKIFSTFEEALKYARRYTKTTKNINYVDTVVFENIYELTFEPTEVEAKIFTPVKKNKMYQLDTKGMDKDLRVEENEDKQYEVEEYVFAVATKKEAVKIAKEIANKRKKAIKIFKNGKQIITTTSTSVVARNVAYLGIIDKLDGKGIAEVNKIIDKI